jgi:Ca2+-binding RTX toxin-like protein
MAIITGQYPSGFAETIFGTSQDDTIYPLGGWDTVDGGLGIDTLVVVAEAGAFRITTDNGTTYLDAISSASSYDYVSLRNVEYVQFSNQTVSLIIDDRLINKLGSENLDGGPGIDTLVYAGPRSNYLVTQGTGSRATVQNKLGLEGGDNLLSIERLEFSDINLALDLNGNAGQSLLFIGAVAHGLIGNAGAIGTILNLFDQGMSMQEVCQLAIDVNLISALAGSSSNEDLARLVWRNVVGVEADAGAVDLLLSFMDGRNAAFSQAQLLATVAQHDVNQQHVNLVGLASTGVEYLPFAG